ncbi:MAG: transglutaminase-like domain-containing protein [Bacteroidota bacterium]
MIRNWIGVVIIGASMVQSATYSQSLFSPRAIGIGAYGPMVSDTRSFTDNPAGIVNMRDWDLTVSTYLLNIPGNRGFFFQGLSMGKRFLERYAVALQYSPATSLDFVIPTTLTLASTIPTSIDQRVSYNEPFAGAFAFKVSEAFSFGIGARYRTEKITDIQYQLIIRDTSSYIERLPDDEHVVSRWNFDLGVHWKPVGNLALSVVGRNIMHYLSGVFPQEFEQYRMSSARYVDFGVAYDINSSLTIAGQLSISNGTGAIGYEWKTDLGLLVRSGLYYSKSEVPFVYGVGVGVGWAYKFFEADVSYLRFMSQDNRKGSGSVREFEASFNSIDLNRYTSDRLQVSLKAMFGAVRASLASIEGVEMTGGVYPSAYEALAYRPLGRVRVKNISDQPIEARVRFFVERYMDDATESQPVYLLPGEVREIPITAVFNERVKSVDRMIVREGNIFVSATPAEEYDDKYATPILIHGKNDWDGSVYSLRYFVTPDDPDVIRYTRDILLQHKDSLSGVSTELESFRKAKILFNAFSGKLVYVNDPKQSADNVQYPSETLQLRGGDCDDMTACFSALLNSVGISTAFVDVIPPRDSSKSHIYLLFDTGLDPKYGNAISSNAKRYVIRKNQKGVESVWIPVETTVIARGFDAAWSQGAQEYFDDVEVGLGLIKGWVKIVDVY